MNITLTALTAAVVTACFVTAGAKDMTPDFPVEEVTTQSSIQVASLHRDDIRHTEYIHSDATLSTLFSIILPDIVEEVNSYATLSTPPIINLPNIGNVVNSRATLRSTSPSITLPNIGNVVNSRATLSVLFSITLPDIVEEVNSYATLSTPPIITLPDIGNVVNSYATLRSTSPSITLPNIGNVVYSYATLSTPPIINLYDTIELLNSGFSITLVVPVKTVEVSNSITSEAHCEAVLPYYDLQYVDAYFKHPSGTAPYFVYGYYNKTIVFGSKVNINTSNVKSTATSSAEVEIFYTQSIPHQIEKANTELGNIQTFHKSMRPTHTHDLVSVFTGRDPSNVSPYRISDDNVVEIITDFKSLIPLPITKEFSPPLSIVSTNASLSIMPYKLANAENTTISKATIGLHVKHTNVTDVVASVNTVLETVSIHTVQGISAIAELESTLNNITTVFGKTAIIDPISVSIQSIVNTQGFAISPYKGLNNVHSEFGVFLHVEDNQTEVIHGVASSGQSDLHAEHINIIGRTETIHTNFENIKLVYNPGVEPISNSIVSENSTLFIVGDNKTITDNIHTLSTDNTTSIQPYKLATVPTQTLSTLFGLHTHAKDSDASSLLSTLSSTGVTSSMVDRVVFKTETLATSYGVSYLVIDSTINNVVHTLITNCVDTLVYKDPVEITDLSETLSTSFGIDMYQIGSYEAVDNLSSDVPNIQLRAKETTPSALNTILTTHVAQYYVTKHVNYKVDTLITTGVVEVVPYKLITMLRDELITEFVVSVYHEANEVGPLVHNVNTYLNNIHLANGLRLEIHDAAHTLVTSSEAHFSVDRLLQNVLNSSATSLGSAVLVVGDNKTVPDLLNNISTSMSIELYKDDIITDVVELSSSENSTTVYIKDATAFPLNSLASSGQSDLRYGNYIAVSRTEQLQTILGNVALHRVGGITDAVNALNTDFIISPAVGKLLTTEALNSLSSAYGIQMSPLRVINNLLNQAQTNLGSILIVVGEDVSSNNNRNSVVSDSDIRFFKDQLLNNTLNTVVTNNITNVFVLHGTPTPLNSLSSSGQSDLHAEHINVIGRTEQLHTNFENIQLVRTPGVNNALNTLITTNVTTFVAGKNNTADHAHIVESSFGVKTAVDYPAAATDGLISTGVVTLYAKHHSSTSVVATAVTTNHSTIIVRKINVSEQLNTTMTALGDAQYSVAHPVTMTLAKQGGTGGTNSITTIAGFSITPASITPPTRTHFTFKGYYTLAAGGTQVINSSGTYVALTDSTYMSPITLYAQWTDVVYTITWKSYNNITLKTEYLSYGSTSTAPNGTSDTDQYDYSWPKESTTVTGDETITETFTVRSYTVTFKGNGGGTPSPTSKVVRYNNTYSTLATVSRTNWAFIGWFTAASGGTKRTSSDTMLTTSNHTLYAHWNPLVASGLLHTMATSALCNIHVEHIDILGYVQTASTALGGAQYENQTVFTITLDRKGGTGGTSSIICVNGFYLNPTSVTAPTRAGYTFGGYFTGTGGTGTQRINSSGTFVGLSNTTYTSAVTLYAKWSTATYTLTNDRNNGTGGNSSATYNIETSSTLATLLGTVTRAGYTFSAWRWTSSTTGGWTNGTNYASSTNVVGKYASGTLQAQWTANPYTVTFNANGGTPPSPTSKSVTYASTYSTLATTSRTNYIFIGWFTAATGGSKIGTSTTVTTAGDHTLYAHWKPTVTSGLNTAVTVLGDMQASHEEPTYSITTSSGTGVASMSVSPTTYQQSGVIQNITITRSVSTGFTLNAATITRLGTYGGSTPTVSGTTVSIPASSWGPFRVNQTATRNSFLITLNANGGTTPSNNTISVTYGSSIEAFNANMLATRTGHTLTGYWTASSGGTQRISKTAYVDLTSTTYSSAATLYAQWTAVVYTVTWKSYNNITLKTDNLIYGSTSTAPTGTSETTQYYYEWPQNSVVVTGNETITETQTTKSYTITWKAYNGAIIDSETLPYGETAYAPTGTPENAQYEYYWPQDSVVVTGPQTIQEIQDTKWYTISWVAYNGATLDSEKYIYGYTVYAPTGTPDDSTWDYYWPQDSVVVTGPQTIQEARRQIQKLSTPQGSLTDRFDYQDGASNLGGVMLIGIYNSNAENVVLNGRILGNGWDFTSNFTHFTDAGGFFFGDTFPMNTGDAYGLSVISLGLMTSEWSYPVTVEVWFEPVSGSTKGTSNKLIITINPETVTATFDSNGGSPTYSSQSGYDSLNVTNPGTPTRSGYTFTGWSPSLPRTITSDTTFVAQWTAIVYTITWKSYTGTTLKTDYRSYGSTSTAPTGTPENSTYDYYWPLYYVVVTGNETIQELRTTKSYTITWKAYNGATLKSETLLAGSISYAPTGTPDTDRYDYEWPKSSAYVAGNETIQETRTQKLTGHTLSYGGTVNNPKTFYIVEYNSSISGSETDYEFIKAIFSSHGINIDTVPKMTLVYLFDGMYLHEYTVMTY